MLEGQVFPPRNEWDIAAYPMDDVVKGYRDHRLGDLLPGPNHPPGYRWGWTNAEKDRTRIADGFEPIRSAYINLTQRPN